MFKFPTEFLKRKGPDDYFAPAVNFAGSALSIAVGCVAIAALSRYSLKTVSTRIIQRNYFGAGVLPFRVDGKDVEFLLGKECQGSGNGTWCDFGGEAYDPSPAVSAAEQCYTEGGGLFGHPSAIRERLEQSINVGSDHLDVSCWFGLVSYLVPSKDKVTRTYIMYLMEVDGSISNERFQEGWASLEKSEICWVKADQLFNAALSDGAIYVNGRMGQLRPSFVGTLQLPSSQKVFQRIQEGSWPDPHPKV